jgi:hypothetical protein
MDDLDELDQLDQLLTKGAKLRIGIAAMVLADLTNEFHPKMNLHWVHLVGKALAVVKKKRACGEMIPDIEKFMLATMTLLSDEMIDGHVQQFVTDITRLNPLERNRHASQILGRLEKVILADDDEAKEIWPLMLEQRSSPETDGICKFPSGRTDTIKKRIRRRAHTYLRGLLGGQFER